MARGGREFFVTGHLEYAPDTLDKEYRRDSGKRDDVDLPKNYYYHDDPTEEPLVTGGRMPTCSTATGSTITYTGDTL